MKRARDKDGVGPIVKRMSGVVAGLLLLLGCTSAARESLSVMLRPPSSVGDPKGAAYAHFIASTVYERRAQFDEAVAELRKASDLDPESISINLQLVRAYVRNQDYENARIVAERAIALRPDNANLRVVLGEIYHQLDRYDEAVASFQKAIELDPENVLGYGSLVSLQESANDLVAAIDIYRRLTQMMPKSAGVHYQLGLCLARINDSEGARAALAKAIELKPDIPHANGLLGIIHLEAGENPQAVDAFKREIQVRPDDPRVKENLVGALGRLGRHQEALDILAQLIKSDKPDPKYAIEGTYLLLRTGLYKQAGEMAQIEGAFSSGVRKDPGTPVKPGEEEKESARGMSLFASILQVIAAKGQGESCASMLGALDSLEGDRLEECNTYLNELVYLFGKKEVGEYFIAALGGLRAEGVPCKTLDVVLARAYMTQDRNQEAIDVLKPSLERIGPDTTLCYLLAVAYDALKQVEPAEQNLKAYLELKPNDAEVMNFLGYLYADHNIKLEQAESLLKRALQIEPENGFYLDSLGWVYYRKGDADRAIDLIRKAIRAMQSDDAELRNHLGDAYLLKGDVEKALAQWKRSNTLNPKLEGVKEKIERHQPQQPK